MKSKVLGIVIILFIGIQFVPYGKDHSNPKSVAEPQWNTKKTGSSSFGVDLVIKDQIHFRPRGTHER
jgi:hypothetical protein